MSYDTTQRATQLFFNLVNNPLYERKWLRVTKLNGDTEARRETFEALKDLTRLMGYEYVLHSPQCYSIKLKRKNNG